MTLIPDLERDLVEAAGRVRRSRRRPALGVALAAAVALAALVVLLLVTDGGEEPAPIPPAQPRPAPYSTGVPEVDILLEREARHPGPGELDRRPGPGGAAEPLDMPGVDRPATAVVYASRSGQICHASAQPHPRIAGDVRGSFSGCWDRADLAARLERRLLIQDGSTSGPERSVFDGYAAAEVESIRVLDERGDFRVQLSAPWTPALAGAEPLRHFVIVNETDVDVGGDGVQIDEAPLIMRPFPEVELTLADGAKVTIPSG
jgi:hypothetical protein